MLCPVLCCTPIFDLESTPCVSNTSQSSEWGLDFGDISNVSMNCSVDPLADPELKYPAHCPELAEADSFMV